MSSGTRLSGSITKAKEHPVVVLLVAGAACLLAGLGLKQQVVGDLETRVAALEKGEAVASLRLQLEAHESTIDSLSARLDSIEQKTGELSQSIDEMLSGKHEWKFLACEMLIVRDPVSRKERLRLSTDQRGYSGLIIADEKGRPRIQLSTEGNSDRADAAEFMLYDGVTAAARFQLRVDTNAQFIERVKDERGLDVYTFGTGPGEQPNLTIGDINGTTGQILKFGEIDNAATRHGLLLLDQATRRAVTVGEQPDGSFNVVALKDIKSVTKEVFYSK